MKALVRKEIRENVKLAALGLVIYTLMLVQQYRDYVFSPNNMSQPLAHGGLQGFTGLFCAIFGAVLGWLQIHNERRPDLWAFLMHRPMTRPGIFLGKVIAGLGLYCFGVGLPLFGFIVWARWPGHVAAPFELTMLRPLAAYVLTGVVFYFAGMLTGLRQARWYASRALVLGVALAVYLLMRTSPAFWQSLLVFLLGAGILIAANLGGFLSHGYYRGQPAWGKAGLTAALMVGSLIVAATAVLFLSSFFPRMERPEARYSYDMTTNGAIFKVTEGPGKSWAIVDLEGKPLIDDKTGHMTELKDFRPRVAKPTQLDTDPDAWTGFRPWMQADNSLFFAWHQTADTLWYYWGRYGRLVGYDIATRRCIGSLGPNGFSQDLSGDGARFINSANRRGQRTLWTATTVYSVDPEKRSIKALFITTSDDPINMAAEIVLNGYDWDYEAVATKRSIHLLTSDGKPVWKAPYEPMGPAYIQVGMYFLQPPGQFALWLTPSRDENERADWKLPIHVVWLARDQGVVNSADLPELVPPRFKLPIQAKLVSAVVPPALLMILPHLRGGPSPKDLPRELLLLSWGTAVLVCLPIGWWLGWRYRFPFAAQAGWAVFRVLFGVPRLLAFLSVQEWAAREACPNCKKLRVVDRAQCEHCGADFAPPEKTGTEVFAPLQTG
jgi:hypothetical protein